MSGPSEKAFSLPPELPGLLLAWYDACARTLPWRDDPAPYSVWVSEIMLQQTRVEAVKPYFLRFLEAFPTVQALAEAPEEQVLKLWEGLGYYNRARNLQKGARQVMERFGGSIPGSFEELHSLAGVGEYTAGAIASIAFGLPVPAVDGNVLRVAARLTADGTNIQDPAMKEKIRKAIAPLLPPDRPGDFNQAVMDLGATLCLPGPAPKCSLCPLAEICRAHSLRREKEFPVKSGKKARKLQERTVLLLLCKGRLALVRRPKQGLLAGLWEPPCMEEKAGPRQADRALRACGLQAHHWQVLPSARHVFTHVEWHMECLLAYLEDPYPGFTWADWRELEEKYPLPSAFSPWKALLREKLVTGN